MSLKAKLEAVIYAAEEPVTLAQLAALFAADALEWKAEQESASATEFPGTPEADESQPFLVEQFDYPGEAPGPNPDPNLDQNTDQNAGQVSAASEPAAIPAEPAAETVSNSDSATDSEANPEADQAASPEAGLEAGSDPAAAAEAELVARRLARQRDREVHAILHQLLDELIASYASGDHGVEIREIAGGYRMATKPECHDTVRLFVKSIKPPLKLSLPALETLAVIAYKQPVTAPEVNEIRGVDSSAVFGSLLARKLIVTAGRKQVIGRPILYKTTREFLLRFGLKDVSELPSMEEFEKMAAIELEEPESPAGEESAPGIRQDLSLELDETDDQPGDEFLTAAPETLEPAWTAVTADSNESQTPAETAPAAASLTEQAETENSPHGEKEQ
ncbi:MAG: SMC-Scp complex subunit ScpB [Terracidiphilus sp.]